MTHIIERLTKAYDKVKEWPENSETGFMDLVTLRNLVPEAVKEIERLREALGDLMTWFPDEPSEPEWRLKAGKYGADDAVKAALSALSDTTPQHDQEDGR